MSKCKRLCQRQVVKMKVSQRSRWSRWSKTVEEGVTRVDPAGGHVRRKQTRQPPLSGEDRPHYLLSQARPFPICDWSGAIALPLPIRPALAMMLANIYLYRKCIKTPFEYFTASHSRHSPYSWQLQPTPFQQAHPAPPGSRCPR